MAGLNYPNSYFGFPPFGTGIASGYTIQPYHVSRPYLEISGIEEVIGLNPLNGYPSLTERISGIESGVNASLTGYWNLSQEQVKAPLVFVNGQIAVLSGRFAGAGESGFLSATDWNTFNNKIASATNVGLGSGLYTGIVGTSLQFKSLIPGLGVNFTTTPQDITINASITGLSFVNEKYAEVPSGLINSSNKVYTLENIPVNNSLELFKNGILLNQSGLGIGTFDYVLSGLTVTTISAPATNSSLVAYYQYSGISGYGIQVGGGGATFTGGSITSSITPVNSGTLTIGTDSLAFATGYFNQYATTRVSGNITSTPYTLNWTNGSSQAIGFSNGQITGVVVNMIGGIPGSTYVLEVYNNLSGTAKITWGQSATKWQSALSGTPTNSGNAIDLFSFYYNGSSYLGNAGNNYY